MNKFLKIKLFASLTLRPALAVLERKRSVKKFLALTAILAVLSIALLSLKMGEGSADKHGMLPDCPYATGEDSACPMDLVDHLAVFKQTFTVLNVSTAGLILILLFAPFAAAALKEIPILNFSLIEKLRRFENKNLHFKLFDWLQLALARGLMQPKLYPLSLV